MKPEVLSLSFLAVNVGACLKPGEARDTLPAGVLNCRLEDGLSQIERCAEELHRDGSDEQETLRKPELEDARRRLRELLSLGAPRIVWMLRADWYDALIGCIARDRERLRALATPTGPPAPMPAFVPTREICSVELESIGRSDGGPRSSACRERSHEGEEVYCIRAELALKPFLDRTLPAGWQAEQAEVNGDSSRPRSAAGRAAVRLAKGKTANHRRVQLVVVVPGARAEVWLRPPDGSGVGPLFSWRTKAAARALLDHGVETGRGWLRQVAECLQLVADRLEHFDSSRSLAEIVEGMPRPGQLAVIARLCRSLRAADVAIRSAVGDRLCQLMTIESWDAIRDYTPVVLGAIAPEEWPEGLFPSVLKHCPTSPSRGDLAFLVATADRGAGPPEANRRAVSAALELLGERPLGPQLAGYLRQLLQPRSAASPDPNASSPRSIEFTERAISQLVSAIVHESDCEHLDGTILRFRPLVQALRDADRESDRLLSSIAAKLSDVLPGSDLAGRESSLTTVAVFEALAALGELATAAGSPRFRPEVLERLAFPWIEGGGRSAEAIPPGLWRVLRFALGVGEIPAEARRAYLTEAALILFDPDKAPTGEARTSALAGWLAEQGADGPVYRSLARRFLERIPEPNDEAEWMILLHRLDCISRRSVGGLDPEAARLLACCAPRPGEPSRTRRDWESLVVETFSHSTPTWRSALACHLLVGLIDGLDGAPERSCRVLAGLGPGALEPSAWGSDLKLLGLRLRHDASPEAAAALLQELGNAQRSRQALPEEQRITPDDVARIVASLRGAPLPAAPVLVVAPSGDATIRTEVGPRGSQRNPFYPSLLRASALLFLLFGCLAGYESWIYVKRANDRAKFPWPLNAPPPAGETPTGIVAGPPARREPGNLQDELSANLKDIDANNQGKVLRLVLDRAGKSMDIVLVRCDPQSFRYLDRDRSLPEFLLGKVEVTREQYEFVLTKSAPVISGLDNPSMPVTGLTWDEADEFCRRIRRISSHYFTEVRLPYQAEWFFAATRREFKAQLDESYPAGLDPNVPRVRDLKDARPGEILDLAGNVKEWMQDYYGETDRLKLLKDPLRGPESGTERVIRGGSCRDKRDESVLLLPRKQPPTSTDKLLGFRVLAIKRQ